jgi:hypothetical protein
MQGFGVAGNSLDSFMSMYSNLPDNTGSVVGATTPFSASSQSRILQQINI